MTADPVGARPALLKPAEAAKWLGISLRTLDAHVLGGRIRYIDVGHGKVKIRRMYDLADLAEFADRNRKVAPCLLKSARVRRSGTTDSKYEGEGFSALVKRLNVGELRR